MFCSTIVTVTIRLSVANRKKMHNRDRKIDEGEGSACFDRPPRQLIDWRKILTHSNNFALFSYCRRAERMYLRQNESSRVRPEKVAWARHHKKKVWISFWRYYYICKQILVLKYTLLPLNQTDTHEYKNKHTHIHTRTHWSNSESTTCKSARHTYTDTDTQTHIQIRTHFPIMHYNNIRTAASELAARDDTR